MDRQQLGTKLTLDALNLPLDLVTFDDRLILQKAIYLAKAAGHDCGHFFRWYLRGPYSPELTRDLFSIKAEIDAGSDETKGWTLEQAALDRLAHVRPLIPNVDSSSKARRLELLASVHFLVERRQISRADAGALRELLAKYDKDFTENDIKDALRNLQDHELLPK